MSAVFDKKQIVSSTELVRSFGKYEDEVSSHDIFIFKRNAPETVLVAYKRYEQMKKELEEFRNLLEHVHIYEIIEQRKDSSERKMSIKNLQKKYGIYSKVETRGRKRIQ